MYITEKLAILEKTPRLLQELIQEIPTELLKEQRIPNKWSIHEHACHLAIVDHLFFARFALFRLEEKPEIKPYLPGTNTPQDELLSMDLVEKLAEFPSLRDNLIEEIKALSEKDWNKQGDHEEYTLFTPAIMLRHLMIHDHFHMFRIQQLWLTKAEYL